MHAKLSLNRQMAAKANVAWAGWVCDKQTHPFSVRKLINYKTYLG